MKKYDFSVNLLWPENQGMARIQRKSRIGTLEMVEMAKAIMDVINAEREEQAKMRAKLGDTRRNTLENFVIKIKKV